MKVRLKKVLSLIVTVVMLFSTVGTGWVSAARSASIMPASLGLDPAFAAHDNPVTARGIGNLLDYQVIVPGQPNAGSDWLNPEWRPVGIGGGGGTFDPVFSPHDPNLWFSVCDMGGTYVSHDAGLTWAMLNFGGTNTGGAGARAAAGDGRAFNFCPTYENIVYAAMSNAGLWKSTDKGLTWIRIFPHQDRSARAHRGDHSDVWFLPLECSVLGCDHRVGGRTMADPGREPAAFANATLGGLIYSGLYDTGVFGADGCMAQNWVGYPRCDPPDNFPYQGRVTNLAVNPANPDQIYIIVRQAQGQNAGLVTRDHLFISNDRGQSFDLIARDVTTRVATPGWPFVDAVFSINTLTRAIKDVIVDPLTGDLLVFTPNHIQRFTDEGVRSIVEVSRTDAPYGNVTTATQADFLWFSEEARMVYFMVNGGFIYRSDDNLQTATRLSRGETTLPGNTNPTTGAQAVERMGISSESVIWYQGGTGGGAAAGDHVFRSTDGGETWRHVWRGFGGSGRANTAIDPGRWSGFGHPGVSWQEYAVGLGANWSANIHSFAVSKASPYMAGYGSFGYITSTRNGGELWAHTNSRIVQGYDDRGNRVDTWVTTGKNVTTTYGVHFNPFNPMHVFMSVTDVGAFQSWDGGYSWRHSGIHGLLPSSGFDDVPSRGRVNSEITWPDNHRRSIGWGTGASGSYADWRNTMYWVAFDPVIPDKLYGVFSNTHDVARLRFFPPRHLSSRTGTGGVAISTDGGRTWVRSTTGLPPNIIPMHIEVGNVTELGTTLFISTHGKGFFKSYNSGQTWQPINNGVDPVRHHYAQNQTTSGERTPGSPPGIGEPAANWPWTEETDGRFGRKIVWVPDETIPYGGALYGLIARSGSEFVGEASGQLYRSFDGGHNWHRVNMPQNSMASRPVNYVSDLVFDPRNPSTVFAAAWQSTNGDPNTLMAHEHERLNFSGGVFISHDRGNTWEQIWLGGENRRVYGLQVDPLNPNNLFVVTFNGEVMIFQYEGPSAQLYTGVGYDVNNWSVHQESGMTFRQASEPFIDMNHPDFIFVTGFGGNLWRGASNVTPRLGAITINGSPIEEFDPNVKTYNVAVSGDSINVEAHGVYHTAVITGTGHGLTDAVITIVVYNEIGSLYSTYTLNVTYNDPSPFVLFSWDIFNNGPGGTQYPNPNWSLAEAGLIRMRPQLDGADALIYYGAASTIIALDQDEQCAMEFIHVARIWSDSDGWLDYFMAIDINKHGDWEYINLYITVYGQTVHALLVNALFEQVSPPVFSWDIFNNGSGGAPSRPNPGLAANGTIRMWTQLDGVNSPVYLNAADTIVALDQNGQCAMEFVRVNRMWVAGTGWADYFNLVDVDKNDGSWQYINLYITVYGQTVHVLLVNALFEPPVEVPRIVSVTPNPATVEQGGVVEIVIITQEMPDGAWVDLNVAWRPGLSIVGGPRFYIMDNQATITVAAAENARLGRDGFAVAARVAGDWGSVVIIDSYAFVIEVI